MKREWANGWVRDGAVVTGSSLAAVVFVSAVVEQGTLQLELDAAAAGAVGEALRDEALELHRFADAGAEARALPQIELDLGGETFAPWTVLGRSLHPANVADAFRFQRGSGSRSHVELGFACAMPLGDWPGVVLRAEWPAAGLPVGQLELHLSAA